LAPEEIFGFDIGEEDPATAGRYRLVTDEDEILGTRSRRKTQHSARSFKVRLRRRSIMWGIPVKRPPPRTCG
jgi:hypothetical protein